MLIGVIRTKDVLLHPITIIHMKGIRGFFKILRRALSTKTYRFINMLETTTITMVGKRFQSKSK